MTLENAIDYTVKVLEWAISKTPDILTDRTKEAVRKLENKEILDKSNRRVIGLTLFTYSMHTGLSSFEDVEKAARELGVSEEIKMYSLDFQRHSSFCKLEEALAPILRS